MAVHDVEVVVDVVRGIGTEHRLAAGAERRRRARPAAPPARLEDDVEVILANKRDKFCKDSFTPPGLNLGAGRRSNARTTVDRNIDGEREADVGGWR